MPRDLRSKLHPLGLSCSLRRSAGHSCARSWILASSAASSFVWRVRLTTLQGNFDAKCSVVPTRDVLLSVAVRCEDSAVNAPFAQWLSFLPVSCLLAARLLSTPPLTLQLSTAPQSENLRTRLALKKKVGDVASLVMLADEEIARVERTEMERVGDAETERSCPISAGCRNHAKRAGERLTCLSGPQEQAPLALTLGTSFGLVGQKEANSRCGVGGVEGSQLRMWSSH